MNISWLLAWRNLWRHRRRTWLTVGAMVFCNILLIFLISLQLGSYQMMIDNSLAAYTGHIQIFSDLRCCFRSWCKMWENPHILHPTPRHHPI